MTAPSAPERREKFKYFSWQTLTSLPFAVVSRLSWAETIYVYRKGPAKTPEGYPSGSFGPTTAGRMDSYVDLFQENGGSFITLAKGNRSKAVTNACKKYGGFYLGSIGGPAAILAKNNIKKVEVLEYAELGMEVRFDQRMLQRPVLK